MFATFCFIGCLNLFAQDNSLEIEIRKNIKNAQFELALSNIEKLESNTAYLKNNQNRLRLNLSKSKVYNQLDQQEKSINLMLKGFSELKDNTLLKGLKIDYANALGLIFYEAENYDKSIDYYNQALYNSLTENDTINTLEAYLNLGKNYYKNEEIDSAVSNFSKILVYPVNYKTQKYITASYTNLGVVAGDELNLDLAEEYANKVLLIYQEQKDTLNIAMGLINLSSIYYDKKDYEKAKNSYFQAFKSVKDLKSERAIKVKEYALYNLAYTNEHLGDFENAYFFLEEATNLTDSLNQLKIVQNISEVEAKYNVAIQAQKVEEEKSLRQRAQFLFYGSALAFLAFIILSYIFYRNYRLKQRNKIEQIENETQTRIINATIDAKEKERKSIAEILHDSVSALLSSANLHLQATKSQLKEGAPKEISKAQVIVNEASVKIRDLSHELISSVLLKFGLAFAVHDICQKYSNSEITLRSDDKGILRYDQDFEIKIYNIIEELINNILKHSKASNATIMLVHRENDMLSVRLSDDGIGFDLKKAKTKDGLGLSHINARVKVMKGVFNIVSSKGNGTSIFILVPIQPKLIN